MKTCKKCNTEKDENEFWRSKNRKDGRHPTCRSCVLLDYPERAAGLARTRERRRIAATAHREVCPNCDTTIKRCLGCDQDKVLSQFGRNAASEDHHYTRCLECKRADQRISRSGEGSRAVAQRLAERGVHRCTVCAQEKPTADFYFTEISRRGRSEVRRNPSCMECVKARSRRDGRKFRLLAEYGLTEVQHAEMVVECGGKCSICRLEKPLVIDHDHGTGNIRGLLCGQCNTGIGMLQDDPSVVERALEYLRRHKSP